MKKTLTILTLLVFLSAKNFAQSLQNEVALLSLKDYYNQDAEAKSVQYSSGLLGEWLNTKKAQKAVLGYTKENRAVEAYYFPGTSDRKALVIGGMHGSELSSIEIAKKLIEELSGGEMTYYNVIIIPTLFPDNAEKAMMSVKTSTGNFGRYSTEESVDPNRQMPPLGKPFTQDNPVDIYGRIIEKENQFLLQLIQDYQPSRIVNLHAIKDVTKGGIYADPRTDCNGYALGFESDSSLAVSMAMFIETNGGKVPGNDLRQCPTALYFHDPEIAPAGFLQKRNLYGSSIPNNRGFGVSLGGWATTSVCDEGTQRYAARLITVEFPGYKPSSAYQGTEKENCILNVGLYTSALRKIFLEDNYVE
jgi:hypothetical protein